MVGQFLPKYTARHPRRKLSSGKTNISRVLQFWNIYSPSILYFDTPKVARQTTALKYQKLRRPEAHPQASTHMRVTPPPRGHSYDLQFHFFTIFLGYKKTWLVDSCCKNLGNARLIRTGVRSASSFKMKRYTDMRSRGSSVSIVTDYGLNERDSISDRGRGFFLVSASRPALGPTQPPVQWVPGVLSPGIKRGRGVMLTTHPHLVPRLRMSRSYTSSHPICLHSM
jgi:hypothetical protein